MNHWERLSVLVEEAEKLGPKFEKLVVKYAVKLSFEAEDVEVPLIADLLRDFAREVEVAEGEDPAELDETVGADDVFDPSRRAAVDKLKPANVEDDAVVGALSKAFGAVERGINEGRKVVENIPGINHEVAYELLDEIADHSYEAWRRIIYAEPMVRWKRSR